MLLAFRSSSVGEFLPPDLFPRPRGPRSLPGHPGAPNAADAEKNAALKISYDNLTASGVQNIHYITGTQILAGEEGEGRWFNPTVGGTHPADVGQYDMADFYTRYLRKLLPDP